MPEIQVKDKLITLEELGVAASGFKGTLTANDDLNNIINNGFWEASADSLPSNVPSGVTTHSFILNYNLPGVSEVYQICVTFASGKPTRWERRYFSGSWGDWCKIPIAPDVVAKTGDTMTGRLTVNCTSDGGEADVEARSAAGNIYLYSAGINTGNRGIYAFNAAGTGKSVITIDQNNNITFNGNAANVTGTVQVDHGGTGAATVLGALQKLFNVPGTDAGHDPTQNYPSATGIFKVTTQIFNNMHADIYGVLVIFRVASYNAHIYISSSGHLYYGFSDGSVISEPTTWYVATATVQS